MLARMRRCRGREGKIMVIKLGQFTKVEQLKVYAKDLAEWIEKYRNLRPDYVFTVQPVNGEDEGHHSVECYKLSIYKTEDGHHYGEKDRGKRNA